MIFINSYNQTLYLLKQNSIQFKSKISTSCNGMGCKEGSFQTPIGLHTITSKIGEGLAPGTLFKHRRPTNRIIDCIPRDDADYITTRIIRLGGLENGINQNDNVDSYKRYIYIHGTPHKDKLGLSKSHGCIRMCDEDIVKLFKQVDVGTLVFID